MMFSIEPTGGRDGLSVRGIGKKYGPITVLSDVDLDVGPGEALALIGENGAGKSTVASIIAGLVPATTGSMTWRGQPYAPDSPADALSAGIGLIHQEMRLLLDLSIAENVFVGRMPMRGGRVDRDLMNRRAAEQLHRLGLDAAPTTKVRHLRVAAQQQVEIAKALTLNARLLIFDEPTAALGGDETERLFEQIGRLKSEGVSFIYISHRLDEIARIADRIAVLRDGRLVAMHHDAQVPVKTLVEEMVGRPLDRMFPEIVPPPPSAPLIEVEGLTSAEGAFEDVSFSVRPGEVFGVAGIVGAGRTELMRAIAGADPIAAGHVKINGDVIRLAGPRDALDHGLVLVPEDRKAQGLILPQTIAENLALGNYPRVAPSGWITATRTQAIRCEGDHTVSHQGNRIDAGQRAFRRQSAEGRHRQEHSARAENRHSRRADPRHRRRRARRDLRHRRRPRPPWPGGHRRELRSRRGAGPVPPRHGSEPRAQPGNSGPRAGGAGGRHGARHDLIDHMGELKCVCSA